MVIDRVRTYDKNTSCFLIKPTDTQQPPVGTIGNTVSPDKKAL